MDAKKLGAFILKLRKEHGLTQLELAKKLLVTDKAVSKWERGLGLPDINLIEPLAEALNVSVLEIMRAEKVTAPEITNEDAAKTITDTLDLVKQQQKAERKAIAKLSLCFISILLLVFLIDSLSWMGFFGVFVPFSCLAIGTSLIVYIIWRKKNKLPSTQTAIYLILALSIPLILLIILLVAGVLGIGPVST